MKFPDKIMSITQIHEECGISKGFLRSMAHVPGQKCAFQKPGGKKFWFDTEKLGKQMEKFSIR